MGFHFSLGWRDALWVFRSSGNVCLHERLKRDPRRGNMLSRNHGSPHRLKPVKLSRRKSHSVRDSHPTLGSNKKLFKMHTVGVPAVRVFFNSFSARADANSVIVAVVCEYTAHSEVEDR